MKVILLLAYLIMFVGCSLTSYKGDSKYHQLAANTNGNYLSLRDDLNATYQCGLNKHLDSIVKRIESQKFSHDGKTKILIYIHGGLNGVGTNVNRVLEHYKDAIKDKYYPIFIGWRSGALTTLNDRYFGVRNGIDSPWYTTLLSSPFYFTTDVLRGFASIPESLWDQGYNFISTHRKRLTGFDEKDIRNIYNDFKDVNIYYTDRGEEKSFWQQTGYAVRQVVPGAARIISTPLIEGFANKSWDVMIRRTKTLMYRQGDLTYRGIGKCYDSNYPSDLEEEVQNQCELESKYFLKNGPNGIVAQLMRALQKLDKSIEITIVGHSMGVIIANDILKEFPNMNYEKIIHMASADSVRNLMDKTLPVLKENNTTKFYNLSLHPTNEEQEQSGWGAAPEGSLLIWLDDMLINPETSLDRRAGRWENIKWAFPFFINNDNMYFKLFGLRNTDKDGKQSEPIIHGDFGEYKFWREEFYWGKE